MASGPTTYHSIYLRLSLSLSPLSLSLSLSLSRSLSLSLALSLSLSLTHTHTTTQPHTCANIQQTTTHTQPHTRPRLQPRARARTHIDILMRTHARRHTCIRARARQVSVATKQAVCEQGDAQHTHTPAPLHTRNTRQSRRRARRTAGHVCLSRPVSTSESMDIRVSTLACPPGHLPPVTRAWQARTGPHCAGGARKPLRSLSCIELFVRDERSSSSCVMKAPRCRLSLSCIELFTHDRRRRRVSLSLRNARKPEPA